MARRASPRRHAQAILQIALENNQLPEWLADLERLAQLGSDATYRFVLESPKLSLSDKLSLLQDRIKGLNPLAVNMLALLISRGRLKLLPEIFAEYQRLVDIQQGIELVEVVTAVPLEDKEGEVVAQRLARLVGKQVRVNARVDPAIIGGLVVRIGDRLIEGSVSSRLRALKQTLVTTGTVGR